METQEVLIVVQTPSQSISPVPANQFPPSLNPFAWIVISSTITWLLTYFVFNRNQRAAKKDRVRILFDRYTNAVNSASLATNLADFRNQVETIVNQARSYFFDMQDKMILQEDFVSFFAEDYFRDIIQQRRPLKLQSVNLNTAIRELVNQNFSGGDSERFRDFVVEVSGRNTRGEVLDCIRRLSRNDRNFSHIDTRKLV
jgi:transcriptional regulator with AAA-type ATPase domain